MKNARDWTEKCGIMCSDKNQESTERLKQIIFFFAFVSLPVSKGLKRCTFQGTRHNCLQQSSRSDDTSLLSTVLEKTEIRLLGDRSHYFFKSITAETFEL